MAVATRRPAAVDDPLYRSAQEQLAGVAPGIAKDAPRNTATARSRIAAVGDSDFATNSFFHIMGNGNLFLNTVNYLAARQDLIGVEPRTYELPTVNLTNRQMKGTFFLAVILIRLRDDDFGVKVGASLMAIGATALVLLCVSVRNVAPSYKYVDEVVAEAQFRRGDSRDGNGVR